MLDIGFSQKLAAGGFNHRASFLSGGRVAYRLVDGSGHVCLAGDDWAALGARFAAEARPVERRATKLMLGLLPATFLFGMTIAQVLPFGGILILAAIFIGPIAIYLWQSRRIARIAQAIETELAHLPRVDAPSRRPLQPPRWIEIAALLLVGPHLALQVVGSVVPNAFRNTPWSGTRLDWTAVVSFSVLAVILLLRWSARRPMAPETPDPVRSGRTCEIVARARGNAQGQSSDRP